MILRVTGKNEVLICFDGQGYTERMKAFWDQLYFLARFNESPVTFHPFDPSLNATSHCTQFEIELNSGQVTTRTKRNSSNANARANSSLSIPSRMPTQVFSKHFETSHVRHCQAIAGYLGSFSKHFETFRNRFWRF